MVNLKEIVDREFHQLRRQDGTALEYVDYVSQGGQGHSLLFKDAAGNEYIGKLTLKDEIEAARQGLDAIHGRITREVAVLKRLNHPGIANGLEEDISERYILVTRPKVKGKTLREYLTEKVQLSESETAKIMYDVATVLDYLHHPEKYHEDRNPVIHRDLKPENIVIRDAGSICLIDFGVASMRESTFTQFSRDAGTLGYLAPELGKGVPADERADIYALGVIGRELLTGAKPDITWFVEPLTFKMGKSRKIRRIINRMITGYNERYVSVADIKQELIKKGLCKEITTQLLTPGIETADPLVNDVGYETGFGFAMNIIEPSMPPHQYAHIVRAKRIAKSTPDGPRYVRVEIERYGPIDDFSSGWELSNNVKTKIDWKVVYDASTDKPIDLKKIESELKAQARRQGHEIPNYVTNDIGYAIELSNSSMISNDGKPSLTKRPAY
ncbi:serine/threonine protein kinase [Candidatus Woesearchaeota archaeon]|nr:serine/threonine protein kinase [Candidatus Woesearchaeota archaeon]